MLKTFLILIGDKEITQYYSDKPYISGVTEGNDNIKSVIETTAGIINIKGFSISVIQLDTPGLSVNNELIETISIYPNPIKNTVFIRAKNDVKSVSIYNTIGKRVSIIDEIINSKIDIKHLKSGIYFLLFETNKGFIQKKIVKL